MGAPLAERLRAEARRMLIASIEPEYATRIRELVPTGMEVLGVRVPAIRALAKELNAQHPEIDSALACDLFDACMSSPCREELLLALGVLERHRRRLGPEAWARVDGWVDGIDNWEICDQLAKNISAPLAKRHPELRGDLLRWARSNSPWRRRFALANATALNQGGSAEVALALEVCGPVLQEAEPIVRQAVAWALREAAKRDAKAVGEFIRAHRAVISPWILRQTGWA